MATAMAYFYISHLVLRAGFGSDCISSWLLLHFHFAGENGHMICCWNEYGASTVKLEGWHLVQSECHALGLLRSFCFVLILV